MYLKLIKISGEYDDMRVRKITKGLHRSPLNEGVELSKHRDSKMWYIIDRIEKVEDGCIFTLKDNAGAEYVFKIQNGCLWERKEKGELKTREELKKTK